MPTLISTRLAEYLRSAPVVAATSNHARDELDEHRADIGCMDIHTDGVWLWPEDLAYYIERYKIALPVGFLESLEARNFALPSITDDDIEQAEQALLDGDRRRR
jgi:hypothetical protein